MPPIRRRAQERPRLPLRARVGYAPRQPLPPGHLLRLAPHLHLAIENALAGQRVDLATRQLALVLGPADAPVDALRLLALAARQLGDDAMATRALTAAFRRARAAGDLIGAVDALRRIDAIGADTEAHWARLGRDLDEVPFAESPALQEWLDDAGAAQELPPEASLEDLVERAFEGGLDARPQRFDPVPLLDALPRSMLAELCRGLQIRVAPEGEPVSAAAGGAPAWITSGSLRHDLSPATVRVGTLVLPDLERDHAHTRAHGPVRLLTVAREAWAELREDPDVGAAMHQAGRHARAMSALRSSAFFGTLSPAGRQRYLDEVRCASVTGGVVVARGRTVAGLFTHVSGEALVVDSRGGAQVEVAQLERGETFGELDVLTGGGAEFDVEARGPVEFAYLPLEAARALLEREPTSRRHLVSLTEERDERARTVAR